MSKKHTFKTKFIPGLTNRPEFGSMFGGFLTEFAGQKILVDCGTVSGAANLVANLRSELQGQDLDLVLLTHAHLDHSGGLGAIFQAWPKTRAVVHAKAIGHLIEPEKLWLGTKKVMGELATMYGQPQPLDPQRLIPHSAMDMAGLRILETPGHAAHHLCYSLDQSVFVGEAVGCPYYQGEKVYCRPATPPRYYPEPTFDSLNKLFKLSEELGVDEAYFAHTQEKGPLKATVLAYQEQLKLWDKIIHPLWLAKNKATNLSELRVHLTDHLFEVDPQLRPLQALAPEALEIEKYFMRNCVDGFLGLYEERKARKSL